MTGDYPFALYGPRNLLISIGAYTSLNLVTLSSGVDRILTSATIRPVIRSLVIVTSIILQAYTLHRHERVIIDAPYFSSASIRRLVLLYSTQLHDINTLSASKALVMYPSGDLHG